MNILKRKIAVAAEAPDLKTRPGVMVRNGKANMERAMGKILLYDFAP
jgi:hypothetical protein